MKTLILLIMLIPAIAFSASWTVEKQGGLYLLKDADNKSSFHELIINGANTKILSVDKSINGLEFINYNSGDRGTSTIVNITRRVIYRIKDKKFLGDFPYQIKVVSDSNMEAESPKWTIDTKKHEIKIFSESEDIDELVKY